MNDTVPGAFGTDASFEELTDKIRGFAHHDASESEQIQMVKACKLLAEETVARWENVRRMEAQLREKLSMADIREAMSEVLVVTREGNDRRLIGSPPELAAPYGRRDIYEEAGGWFRNFRWPR